MLAFDEGLATWRRNREGVLLLICMRDVVMHALLSEIAMLRPLSHADVVFSRAMSKDEDSTTA